MPLHTNGICPRSLRGKLVAKDSYRSQLYWNAWHLFSHLKRRDTTLYPYFMLNRENKMKAFLLQCKERGDLGNIKFTSKLSKVKKPMTHGRLPVEFIKMSPWDKILRQWLCVTNTLDAWVHEACVSQVTQTRGSLFCWNWNKQHENWRLAMGRCHRSNSYLYSMLWFL